MVTKTLPVALAAMTLALAGCTQDELNDNLLADGPVAAQVTAGIGNASTRATQPPTQVPASNLAMLSMS